MANPTRNTATFANFLRHSDETRLTELADFTFNDVVFSDGTILKDVTFEQLTDAVWANISRNTASFTNPSRN